MNISNKRLLLLLVLIIATISAFLVLRNKHTREVDSKIVYFEGRFELLDQKLNGFVPEEYSIETGLAKVDELSVENGSLADEVLKYIDSLMAKTTGSSKKKYYTKEQMDKLMLFARRAQKNYDILMNYAVRVNEK